MCILSENYPCGVIKNESGNISGESNVSATYLKGSEISGKNISPFLYNIVNSHIIKPQVFLLWEGFPRCFFSATSQREVIYILTLRDFYIT